MGWINDEIAESKTCYSSDFNASGNTEVELSILRVDYPGQGYKLYRVSVDGGGSIYMIFDTRSAVQASRLYEQLKNEPDLKISYLKEQGLTYF